MIFLTMALLFVQLRGEFSPKSFLLSCQLFSEGLSRFPVCLFPFHAEKVAMGTVGKQRDWPK